MAPPTPDFRALATAITNLTGKLSTLLGPTGPGASAAAAAASNIGSPPPGGKNMNELMMENNKQLEDVVKGLNKSRETTEKNIRSMEIVGAGLAIVGPALAQYSKYAISLPFQMLTGVQGRLGQNMLMREKDLASGITQTIGGIVGLFNPAAGALIGGLGTLAAPILGQAFRADTSRAAARQTGVEYMASGRLGMDEAYQYNYRISRGDYAAKGMRAGAGGSASAISEVLGSMGIGAEEGAGMMMAMMSQGARGYSKFDINRARAMTDKGIYGFDITQNAAALQIGNRTGFSEDELKAASRRTGFHVPEMAQAAQAIRGQTFMMGMGVGNQVFNAATNTTMSQVMGAPAASQALMQTGQGVAGAASGNEATEMILFQQFQEANPGSSYMDFLEAKSMGSSSEKWRKMMARAAKTFSSMGQMGGLLGVGTKVFQGASKEARGASTKFLRETAGELNVEPITKEEGEAMLDPNAARRQAGIRADARAIPGQVSREEGLQGAMTKTHEGLIINAEKLQGLSDATIDAAVVTKTQLIPQLQALENALFRAGDWLTGGYRTQFDRPRVDTSAPPAKK